MNDFTVQTAGESVLRCERCKKPFDKQSTLKRHGYYCRSRKPGSNALRAKSCLACAARKARCDNRQPACSRCVTRSIACQYPANAVRDEAPQDPDHVDASAKRRRVASPLQSNLPAVEPPRGPIEDAGIIPRGELFISDVDFASLGEDYLHWGDPVMDLTNFSTQAEDGQTQYPSSGSPSWARQWTPTPTQVVQSQQAMPSPRLVLSPQPTSAPRSLVPRSKRNPHVQRTSCLILSALKSYPLMMERHKTLPPFIHPGLLSSDVQNSHAVHMESMNNCLSLMHMFGSGIQGSRKLFWKNVKLECERFRVEATTLNKWELLATLQALLMYILVRLGEGEKEYNNLDTMLLETGRVLSQRFHAVRAEMLNQTTEQYNSEVEASWKDWIFEESCRRLCTVYQIMNLLVWINPGMCEMPGAPLPGDKSLWEAKNPQSWKLESEKGPGTQAVFALSANGGLLKVDETRCNPEDVGGEGFDSDALPMVSANWEDWCARMDGLGALVMLAATLIG